MIYTPLTKKAMGICFEAHKDQVDKSGLPYIHHPLHLAEQMTDEDTTVVALLHDVMEDSSITAEDLVKEGFGEHIINALLLMTHDDDVDYLDYVRAIKGNPIARTVKLADLAHNSDITRLNTVTEKDLKRVEQYQEAKEILLG
jgi:(p)ppGpp synthase/HD superfamily hydrolase